MNAVPESRSASLPARGSAAPRADAAREAFEQALARRSPPRPPETAGRQAGAPARLGPADDREEVSSEALGLALPGPGGDAISGTQEGGSAGPASDPLAALPAAARMALAAALSGAGAPAGTEGLASVTGASLGAGPLSAMRPEELPADGTTRPGMPILDAGVAAEPSAAESSARNGAASGHAIDGARARASTLAQTQAGEPSPPEALFMPIRSPEVPVPANLPAPPAGSAGAAVDAAALVARLVGQVPLSGSPDDAIRMLFPAGSGPIEQIVLNREAGQLNLMVSATPGARETVSRGMLDLERRLRDRGLPVGAVRLADRETSD
jgi:hypothetical protein